MSLCVLAASAPVVALAAGSVGMSTAASSATAPETLRPESPSSLGGPAGGARTSSPSPSGNGVVHAVRTRDPIRVDGHLDEKAWNEAPSFDAFVQSFPREGGEPTQRTEVRVLYDDRNLYVGVVCRDSHPAEIVRPMGRRDFPPYSDNVVVLVNAVNDRRTAFAFDVTAAGVQEDGIYYEDDVYTKEWDAAWSAAAAATPDGWSAELALPLDIFGVPRGGQAPWGFAVRREIARTHEVMSTVLLPPLGRGVASRLGELVGVDPERRPPIQVTPYLATRLVARPRYSDPRRTGARVYDPIADLGLDLKAQLTPGLVLDATANPDFSQVEADEVIQNLTRFEVSFPEKRPFFRQSLDLFKPVGSDGKVPQQLFYPRRIGLGAPILGAGKVSGSASNRVQVGVLDALTAGAGASDGILSLKQPFRFAPHDAYPAQSPATQNYFAGIARWRPDDHRSFGGMFTSALLLDRACSAADASLSKSARPSSCDVLSGNTGGLDWDVRTRNSEWRVVGQLTGSQAEGAVPDRLIADGTHIRRGDLGYGGYLRMGKSGGEPWRFEFRYDHASPKLDVNASGFQKTQNEQKLEAVAKYLSTRPTGPFLYQTYYLEGFTSFTTDARRINRGNQVAAGFTFQLRNFHSVACDAGFEDPAYDVREITGTGIAYRRLADVFLDCTYTTDRARAISFSAGLGGSRSGGGGPLSPASTVDVSGDVTFHPHSRLETRLTVSVERATTRARFVGSSAPGSYTFADLGSGFISATLRQQLVLTPALTLQAYAQLFSEFGRYGPSWYEASAPGGTIHPADLRAIAPQQGAPSFHSSTLNVNLVLRWEYAPGSTLFVIYARSQTELPPPPGTLPSASLAPDRLGLGPTTDSVMLKWTHAMSF